jgi:hypothetical protein
MDRSKMFQPVPHRVSVVAVPVVVPIALIDNYPHDAGAIFIVSVVVAAVNVEEGNRPVPAPLPVLPVPMVAHPLDHDDPRTIPLDHNDSAFRRPAIDHDRGPLIGGVSIADNHVPGDGPASNHNVCRHQLRLHGGGGENQTGDE